MAVAKVQPVPCVLRVAIRSSVQPAHWLSQDRVCRRYTVFGMATLYQQGYVPRQQRVLPPNASSSGKLGVVIVASRISRSKAEIVSASANTAPLVATITGSNTIGTGYSADYPQPHVLVSGVADHPDFDGINADIRNDAAIWSITMSVGTIWTASTPNVFCAVIAVIDVIAWPPSMVTVLISA